MEVKKEIALFCGGIYRDIVAVASRFPGELYIIKMYEFDLIIY